MSEMEDPSLLATYHDSAYKGHFSRQLTGQKSLDLGIWPIMFKDAHGYVKQCDACQMYAKNILCMEMSLHVSIPIVHFEKMKD